MLGDTMIALAVLPFIAAANFAPVEHTPAPIAVMSYAPNLAQGGGVNTIWLEETNEPYDLVFNLPSGSNWITGSWPAKLNGQNFFDHTCSVILVNGVPKFKFSTTGNPEGQWIFEGASCSLPRSGGQQPYNTVFDAYALY